MKMAESIKLLANTVSFTAANTVFGAVAALITVASPTLITQARANNEIIGSVVLDKGSYIIRKARTDTFAANVAVNATAVAL